MRRFTVVPWAIAAALGVALMIALGRAPDTRTDVVEGFYLEPSRGAGEETTLPIRTTARAFELVVPVDPEEGSHPLSLRIERAGGDRILSRDDVRPVYRGRFLLVLCDRADFPDGDYILHVGHEGGETPGFRFRVASQPAAPARGD